jgi:hypothetical protein
MPYEPDPRDWEQKDWLYEKYWGELLSLREVAEAAGVTEKPVREQMNSFGIPRRERGFDKEGTISPFSGFYTEDEVAQGDEKERSHFDESKQRDEDEERANWNGAAKNELIGEKAQFGEA